MKYFTIDWLTEEGPVPRPYGEGYGAYCDRILPSLPADLQRFVRKCSLHDAQLTRLELSVTSQVLIAAFLGDHYGEALAPEEKIPSNYARRFRLTYGGVRSLKSPGNPKERTSGPPGTGVGDLVYDEVELLAPGEFEHRMLFATGFELQVTFTDFALWYEDFEFHPEA